MFAPRSPRHFRACLGLGKKKPGAIGAPGMKVWERMPIRQDRYAFAGAMPQVHNAQLQLRLGEPRNFLAASARVWKIAWRHVVQMVISAHGAIHDSQEWQFSLRHREQAAVRAIAHPSLWPSSRHGRVVVQGAHPCVLQSAAMIGSTTGPGEGVCQGVMLDTSG